MDSFNNGFTPSLPPKESISTIKQRLLGQKSNNLAANGELEAIVERTRTKLDPTPVTDTSANPWTPDNQLGSVKGELKQFAALFAGTAANIAGGAVTLGPRIAATVGLDAAELDEQDSFDYANIVKKRSNTAKIKEALLAEESVPTTAQTATNIEKLKGLLTQNEFNANEKALTTEIAGSDLGKRIRPIDGKPAQTKLGALDSLASIEENLIKPISDYTGDIGAAIINRSRTDKVSKELDLANEDAYAQVKKGWESGSKTDVAAGVAKIAFQHLKVFGNNPGAVLDFISESLPYMTASVTGAGFVAITNQGVNESVESFKEAHEGRTPSARELATIIGTRTAGTALERIGAKKVLPTSGAKSALASVKQAGKKVSTDYLVEGGTEGVQSVLEQFAANQDITKTDLKEVHKSAAIGSVVGAAVGSASEVSKGTVELVQEAAPIVKDAAVKTKTAAAQKINDIVNKTESGKIVNAKRDIEEGKVKDTTEIESPATALGVLFNKEVLDKVHKEEGTAGIAAHINIARVRAAELGESVRSQAEAIPNLPEEEQQAASDKARSDHKQYEYYVGILNGLNQAITGSPTELAKAITAINEEGTKPEQVKETVDRVLGSIEITPNNAPSDASLDTLAKSGQLTPAQVEQTAKFKATRAALNTTTQMVEDNKDIVGVNKEIIEGDTATNKTGVMQHRENAMSAINSGDKVLSRTRLKKLNDWATTHIEKAKELSAAYARVQADPSGKAEQVGDIFIVKGTPKALIDTVNQEAKLLRAVAVEASAAYRAKFVKSATKTETVTPSTDTSKSGLDAKRDAAKYRIQKRKDNNLEKVKNKTDSVSDSEVNIAVSTNSPESSKVDIASETESAQNVPEERTTTVESVTQQEAQLNARDNKAVQEIDETTTREEEIAPQDVYEVVESVQMEKTEGPGTKSLSQTIVAESSNSKMFVANKKIPKNILQSVSDFKTKWLEEGLALPSDIPAVYSQTVAVIKDYLNAFHDTFESEITIKKPEHRGRNPVQNLLNSEGEWNENVVTAMAVAGIEVLERNSATVAHSSKDINRLKGNTTDTKLKTADYQLTYVGVPRSNMAQDIGRSVLSQLGLSLAGDVGLDTQSKLEHSIGLSVIHTLGTMGLVQQQLVPDVLFLSEKAADGIAKKNAAEKVAAKEGGRKPELIKAESAPYIRVATDQNPKTPDAEIKFTDTVVAFMDSIKESPGIVNNIFGNEKASKIPSHEPITTAPTKNRSGQTVPDIQQKAIVANSTAPVVANMDNINVLQFLEPEARRQVLGENTDINNTINEEDRPAAHSKNQGVQLSWDNITNFLDHTKVIDKEGEPFYIGMEVQVQNRAHQTGMITPQSDLVHRHTFHHDLGGSKALVDTKEDRVMFAIAVAAALGVSVDKQSNAQSIEDVQKLFLTDEVKGAVAAIKRILSGETIPRVEKIGLSNTIAIAVKSAGTNTHGLDGLVALAKASSTESFESNLNLEVDAIASGPFLGTVLYAAGSSVDNLIQRMGKSGVFSSKLAGTVAELKKLKDYKNDTYQDMTTGWINELKSFTNTMKGSMRSAATLEELTNTLAANSDPSSDVKLSFRDAAIYRFRVASFGNEIDTLTAIAHIVGPMTIDGTNEISKLGRTLGKPGTMETIYGSSPKNVIQSIAEGVYTDLKIQLIKNQNDPNKLQQYSNHLNKLFPRANGTKKFNITKDNVLTFKLNIVEQATLTNLIKNSYGEALQTTINSTYKEFIEVRNAVNEGMTAISEVYMTVFSTAEKQYIERNGGTPLTRDQYIELTGKLKKQLPILPTAMSTDKDYLDTGINVLKTKDITQTNDSNYRLEVNFNNPANYEVAMDGGPVLDRKGKVKKGVKSFTGYASKKVFEGPGVSSAIFQIHSTESTIMMKTMADSTLTSVFDAIVVDPSNIQAATRDINKHTQETLESYDPIASVLLALDNAIRIAKQSGNETAYSDHAKQLTKAQDALNILQKKVAFKKKEAMDQTDVWSHYMLETAEHTVPTESSTVEEKQAYVDGLVHTLLNSQQDSEIDVKNFKETDTENVIPDVHSTSEIFEKLGDTYNYQNIEDPVEYTESMRELLTEVVSKVIDPIEIKLRSQGTVTSGAIQGDIMYINLGISAALTTVGTSPQQVYMHELIHNVTEKALDSNTNLRRQVDALRTLVMKSGITFKDFLRRDSNGEVIITTTLEAEEKAAEARFNYIFRNTESVESTTPDPTTGLPITTKRNSSLHEFVAHMATNPELINYMASSTALNTPTKIVWLKGDTIKDRFYSVLRNIFDLISQMFTTTKPLTAQGHAMQLVEALAGVKQRNSKFVQYQERLSDTANEKVYQAFKAMVIKPIQGIAQTKLFKRNVGSVTRDTGKLKGAGIIGTKIVRLADSISRAKASRLMEVIGLMIANSKFIQNSLAAAIFIEARGRTENNGAWHDLARKSNKTIDQLRKDIAENTAVVLNEAYRTNLTREEKRSIGRAFNDTDAAILLDKYTDAELLAFLRNPAKLQTAIDTTALELDRHGAKESILMKEGAKSLGYFLVTGRHLFSNGQRNAHAIASFTGVDLEQHGLQPVKDFTDAKATVDALASLYALRETTAKDKKLASDVMAREYKVDPADNGIQFTLAFSQIQRAEHKRDLFHGNDFQMAKGYTKEVLNPNTRFIVAPAADKAMLAKEGYVQGNLVKKDIANDPNQAKQYMYIMQNAKPSDWLAGTMSLTGKRASGADLIKVYQQAGREHPHLEAKLDTAGVTAGIQNDIAKMLVNKKGHTVAGSNPLVNILDDTGKVSGYRYMMDADTKRTVLDKEDSFDETLAVTAGNAIDKVNTEIINAEIVDLAHAEYTAEYARNPAQFIEIGPKVANVEHVELYRLLPETMKRRIDEKFGNKTMFIKREVATLVFGYRKFSLSNFDKDNKLSNKIQNEQVKLIVQATAAVLNTPVARMIESGIQDVTKIAKDVIVIKSGVTLAANIASNTVALILLGVSLEDIAKHHREAIQGAKDYQLDTLALFKLKLQVKVNPALANKRAIKAELAALEERIAANPLKELIDAGVYQTIVEDIDMEDSRHTFKGKFDKFIEPVSSKLGKTKQGRFIKDLGNNLIMSHETDAYKFLRNATQLSDFVARYVLHKHNVNNKKMSQKASIDMIIEIFINYDLPTHKWIQYGNDMGFLWFTKYKIRDQKVIAYLYRNRSAQLLTLWAAENVVLGEVPSLDDSNIVTYGIGGNLGNPISGLVGAVNLMPTNPT